MLGNVSTDRNFNDDFLPGIYLFGRATFTGCVSLCAFGRVVAEHCNNPNNQLNLQGKVTFFIVPSDDDGCGVEQLSIVQNSTGGRGCINSCAAIVMQEYAIYVYVRPREDEVDQVCPLQVNYISENEIEIYNAEMAPVCNTTTSTTVNMSLNVHVEFQESNAIAS